MTLGELFAGIANAIRSKDGTTDRIPALTFPERILALSGGGGGGGDGSAYVVNVPVNISASVSVTAEDYNAPPTYTSACNETTGGTTLTGTITAKAGDWVLASVTTRSAATYPDGWTLLHESDYVTQSGVNQKTAFLCKKATAAGSVSCTVNQAASGRIYMNLIAVSNCQGFRYHSGSEKRFTTAALSFSVTKPNLDYVIWGCTAVTFSNGGGLWSCPEISTSAIGLGSSVASRQGNFFDADAAGGRTFVLPGSDYTSVAIIDYVEVID